MKETLKRNVLNVAVPALFTALLAGAWLLMPAYKTQAANAAPVFDAKCAMCHSKDGSGNSPMGKNMHVPDLRSKTVQSKSDTELYNLIAKGKGIMPHYGNQLSKAQINDLVAYIRELGKKK